MEGEEAPSFQWFVQWFVQWKVVQVGGRCV